MIELKKPLVFLDAETTGTDCKTDYVVQLALIKVMPDGYKQEMSRLIKPPIPIPASATEVHGVTDEMVKDCQPFSFYAKSLLTIISGCDIAGFNSNSFDIPLLNNEFKRSGVKWDWQQSNFIDVGNIFKIKEPRTLSAAVEFYTGEKHSEAHEALADVQATINVFNSQLVKYMELQGKTVSEVALMSNFDREIVDLTGTFRKDADGDLVFNFGKNKDKKAIDDISYLQWIVDKSTFEEDVKNICKGLLTSYYKQKNYRKN